MEYSSYNVNTPQWREITVGSHLPAELRKLAEIAHNLWWTWNDDVKKLYCDLDPGLWKEVEQNPVLFLERINYEKLVALAHDENFVYKMDAAYRDWETDRKSTRLNSSHITRSRMPASA